MSVWNRLLGRDEYDIATDPDYRRANEGVEPNVEAAREIAWEMSMDWFFHDLAIDDPFAAERKVHDWARGLLGALGAPDNVYIHDLVGRHTQADEA